MDSSPPSEGNYAERLLAQNGMDVELDNTLDLDNQRSWADQADDRSPFPQSNVPSGQNEANTPDPAAHLTGINPAATSANLEPSAIPYQANQPADPTLWDGSFSSISLFGTIEALEGDAKNIACSLQRIATFIKQRPLGDSDGRDFPQISDFGMAAWDLISAIYNSGWDKLVADDNSRTFRQCVASQFNRLNPTDSKTNNIPHLANTPKSPHPANISKIPPPIPPRPSAIVLAKSKLARSKLNSKSFAQATKGNAVDILKVKEAFPKLAPSKIIEIHNIAQGINHKAHPKLNMTTKGPSRKQVIIPMSQDNSNIVTSHADEYIFNINRLLKSTKSNVTADFIRSDGTGIIVTTNQVASASDMNIMENYIKGSTNVNTNEVSSPRLPQSKSYLKILGIPYLTNNNTPITRNQIEEVIKRVHLFNDVTLASSPRIIKASPKSDMAVIWIDIWDSQNGAIGKNLINRCFNIGKHIATIRGTNMNPGVPQCKNCWKWGHTTFACRSHGSKCLKCNGPHKVEHHRDLAWCCKANFKTNPPRLETKAGEPCPHSFKCINCKGEHSADDTKCPFWRNRFNREWHSKKAQEAREIRANSICLSVGGKNL